VGQLCQIHEKHLRFAAKLCLWRRPNVVRQERDRNVASRDKTIPSTDEPLRNAEHLGRQDRLAVPVGAQQGIHLDGTRLAGNKKAVAQ
jgi:hypothetical protein